MRKHFRICIGICLCFILQSSIAFVAEEQAECIIPEAVLSNSEDRSEIERLAPEIVKYANLFEEENVHVSEADIDFSRTYCVYVDADIFSNLPMTRQKLEEVMESASKVWAVPVHANGKTVLVQVSRAPELSEVERTNITSEEQQEIEERAGKWCVTASTCYEGTMDFEQQLQESLATQNKSTENTKCILFGGIPGIQTVLAVLVEGDATSGIVSLQRDISVESDPQMRNGVEGIVLKQNVIYPVETYAQSAGMLRSTYDEISDNTTGATESKVKEKCSIGYFMMGGIVVFLIVVALVLKMQFQRRR